MSEDYPKWIYPPDGGPGKVIEKPEDCPKGWFDHPLGPQAAGGERVIGQPVEHTASEPDIETTHVASEVTKPKPKK